MQLLLPLKFWRVRPRMSVATKLTGTMKNNGAVSKKITTRDEDVTIPQGFNDGSGKVGIDATEKVSWLPTIFERA